MSKMLLESYLYAHGAKPDIPSFIEMTHKTKQREQTAEEIKQHLIDKFSGKE